MLGFRRLCPSLNTRTSRRDFLGLAAAAGLGLLSSANADMESNEELPLQLVPGAPRSRVVQGTFPHVVVGSTVHKSICREMLTASMTRLTDTDTINDAWHAILKPDDIIGIKFNRCGQSVLRTTDTFADVLIESLIASGWRARQIVCVEPPPGLRERFDTTPPRLGYQREPTDFGSGVDHLASVLDQVTALINVPFLKTHNITGMTGCLKNLSHGLIKHPARYHANGCCPYIADIVALEAIRGRLRLCLVDAMRPVFRDGPEPKAGNIANSGIMLASRDPVAADAVGLVILDSLRKQHELPPISSDKEGFLPQLASAHRRGIGTALLNAIDWLKVSP